MVNFRKPDFDTIEGYMYDEIEWIDRRLHGACGQKEIDAVLQEHVRNYIYEKGMALTSLKLEIDPTHPQDACKTRSQAIM